MKIVITPAKRMYQEIDYFDALSKPIYIKESEIILNNLKTYSVLSFLIFINFATLNFQNHIRIIPKVQKLFITFKFDFFSENFTNIIKRVCKRVHIIIENTLLHFLK